jgi:hypothetical protein
MDVFTIESLNFPSDDEIDMVAQSYNNSLSSVAEGLIMPLGFRAGANWVMKKMREKAVSKGSKKPTALLESAETLRELSDLLIRTIREESVSADLLYLLGRIRAYASEMQEQCGAVNDSGDEA